MKAIEFKLHRCSRCVLSERFPKISLTLRGCVISAAARRRNPSHCQNVAENGKSVLMEFSKVSAGRRPVHMIALLR